MQSPVRYWRGRVEYTGRIDRSAFVAWSSSANGRSVLEPIAARTRFAPFGRMRTARGRVWRELSAAARSEPFAAELQREVNAYVSRLDMLVHGDQLPRVGIDLHRLVVVPRFFANAAMDRRLDVLLEHHHAFATANGRRALRDWFILSLIDGVQTAIAASRPSPKRPLPAGTEWTVVGVNDRFEWRVPVDGPPWPGHFYLLELTRAPITRAIRKAALDAIARLEASLPSLSRLRRDELLRQASASLRSIGALADGVPVQQV